MRPKYYLLLGLLATTLIALTLSMQSEVNNRVHQHLTPLPTKTCTHDDSVFCTHLPLLSIDTVSSEMPSPFTTDTKGNQVFSTEEVSASLQVFDSTTTMNHLTDTPTLTSDTIVHYRGNSSRTFDKKGISLTLTHSDASNRELSLLGMAADADWVLHGPYLDKTLLRNYMWYNIAGECMPYSPNVRFCELFLNGEYLGIYVLMEKIDYSDEGRVPISFTPNNSPSTSYIFKIDRGDIPITSIFEPFSIYSGRLISGYGSSNIFEITFPSKTDLIPSQRTFIEDNISQFEKALYSFDYKHPIYGYKHWINATAFMDYFILNEFTTNYDSMGLSTYFYKDINGKLTPVVWDFNSSADNYQSIQINPNTFQYPNRIWYQMLLKDEKFVSGLIARYRSLRQTYLSDDYLFEYIDDVIAYLGPAITRNYEKWGYIFEDTPEYNYLSPTSRNPRSFEQAVEQLKSFIIERGTFMDQQIETLYQYSHPSVNKKFNHEGDT